jgi:hypothetical protein
MSNAGLCRIGCCEPCNYCRHNHFVPHCRAEDSSAQVLPSAVDWVENSDVKSAEGQLTSDLDTGRAHLYE